MDLNLIIVVICAIILIIGIAWILLALIADLRWQRNNQPSLIVEKRAKKREQSDYRTKAGELTFEKAKLTDSELRLARAGIPFTARSWNLGQLVIAFILFVIGVLIGNVLLGFVLALCVPVIARVYTNSKINSRNLLFEKQLNEAEMQMAENLRSGLSVSRAIRTVSEQTEDPLKTEFERVYTEMTYSNTKLSEALQHMADRTGQHDVELLATVLRIQEDSGSDLSESLEYLADTLAKRLEMRNAIKVELAQIKMTIKIVACTPPGILIFTLLAYAGYMEFYSSPFGIGILSIVAVVELVGLYALNKISTVKFD